MRVCAVCLRCYDDAVGNCLIENHSSLTDGRSGSCEIVPNYKIESLIEITDLYEVYSAINFIDNQLCTIKIIPENLIDDSTLTQQILRETQILSDYQHANLVNVYESGILSNGDLYIVSELVKGQTLRQSLSSIGVSAEITAVTIARQSLEGLEALHSLNLIHRNINPDNILLTTDAENRLLVKIQNIDFGGFDQQSTVFNLSNSETNLNKIKYFSPEQCMLGENINHLTDIYSLGIVLYEMLTGKPPFESAEINEIVEKHLKTPVPPIHIANYDIRALLTHILTLSLQKHPTSRHKTANTFARQLRHLEQIVTHTLAPPTPVLTKVAKNIPSVQIVTTQELNKILDVPLEDYKQNNQPVLSEEDIDDVINAITPTTSNEVSVLTKESAVENKIDAQENPNLTEKVGFTTTKPILIEWHQPEDIPLEAETPQIREYPQTELEQYEFYNEEDFVTNSPDREFEEDEILNEDETKPIPVFSKFGQTASQSFVISNQTKLIGGGAIAVLALIVFGVFINNQIFSAGQEKTETAPTTVSKNQSSQKVAEEQMIAKETKEPLETTEQPTDSEDLEIPITNLEQTTTKISSSDIPKVNKQNLAEKDTVANPKPKEDNLAKEKNSKVSKDNPTNVKIDKKGNPITIKEPEKTQKSDNFTRPRVVNENPRVKITDNLKDSAKKDTKKKPN